MRTVVDDRPVVFVDKDGTLIEDLPYNVDPARVRFAPGARDAVRRQYNAEAGRKALDSVMALLKEEFKYVETEDQKKKLEKSDRDAD